MTFANFCIYLLGAYLLYYFAILVWDSIFNAKKTEKPDEVHLDISNSQPPVIDEAPQAVNESDYLTPHDEKKKVKLQNVNIKTESNVKTMKVTELISSLRSESKAMFAGVPYE